MLLLLDLLGRLKTEIFKMKNENKPKIYSFDALAPEFLNGITPLALKLYENVCTFRMISDKTPQEDYASQIGALAMVVAKLLVSSSDGRKEVEYDRKAFVGILDNYISNIYYINK